MKYTILGTIAFIIPLLIGMESCPISSCSMIGREREAQLICADVDGRDYHGCVRQQANKLRHTCRSSQ
jgi:hypothetical protein